MKKTILLLLAFFLFSSAQQVLAHQPSIIYLKQGDIKIQNPEISQAFYDELKGSLRNYFIDSDKDFELYVNLLVPLSSNREGRYSANIFLLKNNEQQEQVASIDGALVEWQEFYEPFGRDYYFKGPEFEKQVSAGKYKIEVYSSDNLGKYVLAVGKKESYNIWSLLNIYWQIPLLKIEFFKTSVLQFFLTPFGIAAVGVAGGLIIIFTIIRYLIISITETIKRRAARTILLTSAGMAMKDQVSKLLQKPAYDITVAFITTAYKNKLEENPDYINEDFAAMREMGFNIEKIDIEGQNEKKLTELLELKDIIFVAGGNTFYLLKAMRACNFEKVVKKLLKQGKAYIGASAGSIVAGRTIKTAAKFGTGKNKNFVGLKNLRGLNLVPFDIFVHYQPEDIEIIKKNMPWKWQRRKLKILTDEQAILVQGKEIILIGEGEKIII